MRVAYADEKVARSRSQEPFEPAIRSKIVMSAALLFSSTEWTAQTKCDSSKERLVAFLA